VPLQRRTPLKQGKGLSPGKPLKRTAPIASGAPKKPTQRAPLARTSSTPKRAPFARKPPRHTGTTADVRMIVHARDGGLCVRCGQPASDQDHRYGRGAGGTKGEKSEQINQPAWILTLCGSGNTSGCHGWKEANLGDEAARLGYKIKRNGRAFDAEELPVLTRFGWVLFDNEGGITATPKPPYGDARNAPPLNP
jgi:hypothetical protein